MSNKKAEETGHLSLSERLKLLKAYTKGPAAFGSVAKLVKATGLERSKVKSFLHERSSYTKFYSLNRRFQRLHCYATHINHIWTLDLAFVDKLEAWNNHVKYLLVCVDVFSRFVRVQPLKNKHADTTKKAFIKMLKNNVQPKKIWIDKGTEFSGSFKSFCKDVGISIYHTFSETKASIAERSIRSLKNIIYRFMEEKDTFEYYKNLPEFVHTINKRTNRMLGMAPADVSNRNVMSLLYSKLKPKRKAKFQAGNHVRISKNNIPFQKGYKPHFTNEIFEISRVYKTSPLSYNIKNTNGEKIQGRFYQEEVVLHTQHGNAR